MLVLSRPNAALLAAAVAIPLFLRILLDKGLTWRQRLLESACPFLIPVLIGAAGIMYYNYIRFDSVFELHHLANYGERHSLEQSDFKPSPLWLHALPLLYRTLRLQRVFSVPPVYD